MNTNKTYTEQSEMLPDTWQHLLQINANTDIGSTGKTLANITIAELHEVLNIAPPDDFKSATSATINTLEVADVLGISRNAAYKLVKSDNFPSFRVGTRLLVPRKKFEQWLDEQVEKPKQKPEDLS